jgi:hypothetical protein
MCMPMDGERGSAAAAMTEQCRACSANAARSHGSVKTPRRETERSKDGASPLASR